MAGKGSPKGVKQGGRKKGTPNKTTAALKDMILQAASLAGDDMGGGGAVNYLRAQATLNPAPFMALLGKVLPLQIANAEGSGAFKTENVVRIEFVRSADKAAGDV